MVPLGFEHVDADVDVVEIASAYFAVGIGMRTHC
jgi:hypothetical protein